MVASRPYTRQSGFFTARPLTGATAIASRPYTRDGGAQTARPLTGATPRPYTRDGVPFASRPHTRGDAASSTAPSGYARPHTHAFTPTRPFSRGDAVLTRQAAHRPLTGAAGTHFLDPWPGEMGRPDTVATGQISPRRARPAPPRRQEGRFTPAGQGRRGLHRAGSGGEQGKAGVDESYDHIMRHITVNMEAFGKGILEIVPDFVDRPAQDFLQHLIQAVSLSPLPSSTQGLYEYSASSLSPGPDTQAACRRLPPLARTAPRCFSDDALPSFP